MAPELKEGIRKFNKITDGLKKEGLFTVWDEREKRTEIYIPGSFENHPRTVGYITKSNEIIRF